MTADVQLRPMRWWDLDEVMVIEADRFGPTAWSLGQFWSELARVGESRWYVIAEQAGHIVGYAGLYAMPPDADVQTIAVAASVEGQGVGTQLLDALIMQARVLDCAQLFLEVAAGNESALALYARRGFEKQALRRGYYGPGMDAILMRCRLRHGAVDSDGGAVDSDGCAVDSDGGER